MGTYIISIAAAAVISSAVALLTPTGWSKYIGAVAGAIIMICIARPIVNIMGADFFVESEQTKVSRYEYGYNEGIYYDEVKNELEKRINDDAKWRLKKEFNKSCEVETKIGITENGKIIEVSTMEIVGDKPDFTAIGRLRDIYDVKEVKYVGVKEITQKSE